MEETNSGITVSDRLATLISRSSSRPALSAARTPAPMPSGTTIRNTMPASFSELTRAAPMKGATGER